MKENAKFLKCPICDNIIEIIDGDVRHITCCGRKMEEMKDILYVLNGTKRVTKNESIQDAPVNIDGEIKVDFHFIEAGVSTIFVYKKNNSYYIEQPYNGIYQISGDEYNSIEKLVR